MSASSKTAQALAIGFVAIVLTAVALLSPFATKFAISVALVAAGTGFLAVRGISVEVFGQFATLAMFSTVTFNGFRPGGIPLADGLLIVALASLVVPNILKRGFEVTTGAPLVIFVATVGIAAVLGELFFPSGGSSLIEAGQLFLATAGISALAYRFAQRTGNLDQLILWFVLGCAFSAGLAILEQAGISSLSQQLTGNSSFLFTRRSSGLTTHPNQLGLASAMALPLAFYIRERYRGWQRVAGGASIVALSVGVLASGSRAAILAVALTFGLATIKSIRSNDRSYDAGWTGVTICVGALVIFAVIVWIPSIPDLLFRTIGRVVGDNSTEIANADRSERLATALAEIVDSPIFGAGFVDSAAHSWPVQIFQTTGVIGFIGLVVPHLVRLVSGSDHRIVLPASALAGGALLIVADTLARTIMAPRQLPVGALTAAIGVPLFLVLMSRVRHQR